MRSPAAQPGLNKSAGLFRRVLQYTRYDWTREMPGSKRIVTWIGVLIQGYGVYCLWSRSLIWPLIWPHRESLLYLIAFLLYVLGAALMNAMLTSEFVRKTELESDQIAARQIQQTLIPATTDPLPGYTLETYYKPLRDVGGDYFDVIELPSSRTLIAFADVSGKGMPAALLAANIQALVRSFASIDADPLVLTRQINRHLSRYTPIDRFATAVFIVLHRGAGELIYVNAGHNPPLLFGSASGSATSLEATGVPLGLFPEAGYEARTALLPPGGALLIFTDGLTDSISGDHPENRLREALANASGNTMSLLKALVNPRFNEDDIAILLVKRDPTAQTIQSA